MNRSSVDIAGNKDRRKSIENTKGTCTNASLARLTDPVNKNGAMRHDKDSTFTSSKESITNSKLKITRSFQHINVRIPYVRSKIFHNSSHKKKIERSSTTQNTKYSQTHRSNTVDYPNQSPNRSQSVYNNLSIVYSRHPRTPATKENNINHLTF